MESFQVFIVIFGLSRLETKSTKLKLQCNIEDQISGAIEFELNEYSDNSKFKFSQKGNNVECLTIKYQMPDVRVKFLADNALEKIAHSIVIITNFIHIDFPIFAIIGYLLITKNVFGNIYF